MKNKENKICHFSLVFLLFFISVFLLMGIYEVNGGIAPIVVTSYSAKILNIFYSGTLLQGNTITLKAYVENTGSDFPQSCELWYLLKIEGKKSQWFGPKSCYPLPSGLKREYDFPLKLKSSGKYTLCGEVWYKQDGKYLSISERRCTSFYVEGSYSAQITQLWDVEIKEDGKASLWAEVKNTGDKEIDSNCKVRYWVKGPRFNNYVGDTNAWLNWKGLPGPLRPGEKRWYEFKWFPSFPGNYQYWAVVECNGKEVSKWSKGKSFEVVREEIWQRDRRDWDYCLPWGEIQICLWIRN